MLRHYYLTMFGITALVFVVAAIYRVTKGHWLSSGNPSERQRAPILELTVTCGGLCWFIVHFGNRQFGGYDYSVLIDTGWRLANGQHPYTDFICTLPPAFMLGAKYAFALWSPS